MEETKEKEEEEEKEEKEDEETKEEEKEEETEQAVAALKRKFLREADCCKNRCNSASSWFARMTMEGSFAMKCSVRSSRMRGEKTKGKGKGSKE